MVISHVSSYSEDRLPAKSYHRPFGERPYLETLFISTDRASLREADGNISRRQLSEELDRLRLRITGFLETRLRKLALPIIGFAYAAPSSRCKAPSTIFVKRPT